LEVEQWLPRRLRLSLSRILEVGAEVDEGVGDTAGMAAQQNPEFTFLLRRAA
jgi:hypothetical protein